MSIVKFSVKKIKFCDYFYKTKYSKTNKLSGLFVTFYKCSEFSYLYKKI